MTIEWLAGNRLRGTTAERPALGLPSGSVGGWKEVARHTLNTETNPILVDEIPDKRYYMILWHTKHTSGSWNQPRIRFGNGSTDAGGNYAQRYQMDYGQVTDALGTNTYMLGWAGQGRLFLYSTSFVASPGIVSSWAKIFLRVLALCWIRRLMS